MKNNKTSNLVDELFNNDIDEQIHIHLNTIGTDKILLLIYLFNSLFQNLLY